MTYRHFAANPVALHLPKAGHSDEDYEDAGLWRDKTGKSGYVFRCAVADGATETSFSKQWADLLVTAFVDGRMRSGQIDMDVLLDLQKQWQASVSTRRLPWYAEEKARMGAFSSLVGLTVWWSKDAPAGKWDGFAVGDSCLFQVREDELLVKSPLKQSSEFNNRPALLGSRSVNPGGVGTLCKRHKGTWLSGDAFYLMTDALACWFLHEVEAGGRPWDMLNTMRVNLEFAEFIHHLRGSKQVRNDDVTLLRLYLDG